MKLFSALCVAGFVTISSMQVVAGPTFTSGPQQVSLVEFYTSQGCSSCPPAEKWLSTLKDDFALWTKFVPIAFHITYWDHLGWKDVAGNDSFNARQRNYAAKWGTSTVYTPCFVRNGAEWRRDGNLAADAKIGTLQLSQNDDGNVTVTFAPLSGNERDYQATVAFLGNDMVTKVQRGENAGRNLGVDFAVLSSKQTDLARDAAGKYSATITLPAIKAPRIALVAWVEERGQLQPLQATGGWLP